MGESLEQKAVRRVIGERWPISADQRRRVVCDLADILADSDADYRARVRAGQVLGSLDALNLKEEVAEEAKRPPAGGVLGAVVHAHVSVAPEAVTAFLEDLRPREEARRVIEGAAAAPTDSSGLASPADPIS